MLGPAWIAVVIARVVVHDHRAKLLGPIGRPARTVSGGVLTGDPQQVRTGLRYLLVALTKSAWAVKPSHSWPQDAEGTVVFRVAELGGCQGPGARYSGSWGGS